MHKFQGLFPDVWLPLTTEEMRRCSRMHSPRLGDLESTVRVLEGKDFLVCAHRGLRECLQQFLIKEPSSLHRTLHAPGVPAVNLDRGTRFDSQEEDRAGLSWPYMGPLFSTWEIMFG